jgi:hypothetical protein
MFSRAAALCVSSTGMRLHRAHLLRPSPPARGRRGEFDGGQFFFFGAGEAPSWVFQQRKSCNPSSLSTPLVADVVRLTSKVYTRPIQKPVMVFGISTSMVRPFSRSASALSVCSAASGSSLPPTSTAAVPASSSTVETEGPDCF